MTERVNSSLDISRLCGHFSTAVSIIPPNSTHTHHHPGWVGWGYSGSLAGRNSKKHLHPTVTTNEMALRMSVPSHPFTTKCTVTVRPTSFSAMHSCSSVRLSIQLPPLPCLSVRLPTACNAIFNCPSVQPPPLLCVIVRLSNSLHCHV